MTDVIHGDQNTVPPPAPTPKPTPKKQEKQKVEKRVEKIIEKNDKIEKNSENSGEKKPPLTAQVSFEDNHVRIVFQRAMSIHVVEVPFPEI